MNIFDQYGIKEVADVTLYAIELDKYDDEIYVPIMYFDTLKVSTIEQTAEQTTARGGVGNPELIAWDFGKEITITLEDALYTPASQSLMWGGKFGINKTKIYGVWNPYIYETDKYGRPIYIKKTLIEAEESYSPTEWALHILIGGKALHFIVPLYFGEAVEKSKITVPIPENAVGQNYVWFSVKDDVYYTQYTLILVDGEYMIETSNSYQGESEEYVPGTRIESTDVFDDLVYFTCPCDGEIKWMKVEAAQGHYKYYREEDSQGNWGKDHWQEHQLIATDYKCPKDAPIQESEEIEKSVQKYALEDNLTSNVLWANNAKPERATISIDNFGSFEYHAYEFVSKADEEEEDTTCYYQDIDFCDDGVNTVKCTTEHIDAYGYIWKESDLKITSWEGEQDIYLLEDADLRYRIRTDNNLREIALEYSSDYDNNYQAKIDVYKNITFYSTNEEGIETEEVVKVLAGTFYIIDDWNAMGVAPQEFIYEINSGMENVYYLERMEKCLAPQTFAIDADKNTRCNNYRYMKAYNNTELTVFLNPKTMKPYEPNADSYIRKNGELVEGNLTIIKQNECYYKWTRSKAPESGSLGYQIIVDAEHYPGTYKLVGETYARARKDGQDQRYQFEIPLCKMSSETNLTLEAEGEPTTFNMSFRVLRKDDGTMMKLTQYDVQQNIDTGSTTVVPVDGLPKTDTNPMVIEEAETKTVQRWGSYRTTVKNSNIEIVNPTSETVIYIDEDTQAPFTGVWPYVSKIETEDLNTLIQADPIPVGEETTETIDNYNFIGTSEDIESTWLIVKKTTTYQVDRLLETVIQNKNGSYGKVISSEWIPQKEATGITYLKPDEYNFDMEGNITLTEAG